MLYTSNEKPRNTQRCNLKKETTVHYRKREKLQSCLVFYARQFKQFFVVQTKNKPQSFESGSESKKMQTFLVDPNLKKFGFGCRHRFFE
jgi:hypothetical protein